MTTTPEQSAGAAAADRDRSRPRVVVGVDGSPGSRAALVHALITAAGRGADLDVVSSYAIELYYVGGAPLDVPDLAGVRDDTHDRAADLVKEVLAESAVASVPGVDDVTVRFVVSEGPAAQALVDHAATADLLVVGSRGRGAMRSALLGSVALHCVTHSACPVLVVHPVPVGGTAPGRVVVGVDGSPASREALEAALAEAARTGAEVEAVAGHSIADTWTDLGTVIQPTAERVRDELRQRTEQTVAEVLAARPAEGGEAPKVRTEVVEGPAAEVLVTAARGAELLVVGSRGRGALRGLLLGSVALHCAMHAPCPVLVVHPDGTRPIGPPAGRAPAPAAP